MDNEILYIWLSRITGIGPILSRRLINYFGNIEEVYRAEDIDLLEVEGIGRGLVREIIINKSLEESKILVEECIKKEIQIITRSSNKYPSRLKNNDKAPILLYVRGTLKEYDCAVSIVGSRRCNEYGKSVAVELAEGLSKLNIPIISGMAKGIDGYAHTVALNRSNYTIAVLGTSVDRCYPVEHINLMNKIIEHGAVVSQFPPGSKNVRENFAKRNEIIAMLSDKIVVIQASEKSGALYTAKYGMSIKKEVYTTPGDIKDELSAGTNNLLYCGVKPYLSIKTLISKLDITNKVNNKYNEIEKKIIAILNKKARSIDTLKSILEISEEKLVEIILEMEFKGYIKQGGGLYYSLHSA